MGPVVLLEPSEPEPVVVPSSAVVPTVAPVVDDELLPLPVVDARPVDVETPSDVLATPPEPLPNAFGEQATRHTAAIASPRTHRA
jgi:hypothetical protein